MWKDISGLSGDCLVCGDFNMVEQSSDRFSGLGYVIQGQEELDWFHLVCQLNLSDISKDLGSTWSNK